MNEAENLEIESPYDLAIRLKSTVTQINNCYTTVGYNKGELHVLALIRRFGAYIRAYREYHLGNTRNVLFDNSVSYSIVKMNILTDEFMYRRDNRVLKELYMVIVECLRQNTPSSS